MENATSPAPGVSGLTTIIATLEQQLATLDAIGACIAAAHLDAAIVQLRLEQARYAAR